jgi:hypothetical protein
MLGAILRFDVKPEHREAFIQAVAEHGRVAVPTEPGTLRFDVIANQDDPIRVFLYEAYAERRTRTPKRSTSTSLESPTSGSFGRSPSSTGAPCLSPVRPDRSRLSSSDEAMPCSRWRRVGSADRERRTDGGEDWESQAKSAPPSMRL